MTSDSPSTGSNFEGNYGLIEASSAQESAPQTVESVMDPSQTYGLIDQAHEVVVTNQSQAAPAPSVAPSEYNFDEDNRYLIFRLNKATYATPILTVREVTEMQVAKPLPHTPDFFMGVSNLRGQIVSIVDLRKMFGMATPEGDQNALIIVDTSSGAIGCIVDNVESVSIIERNAIDSKTRVECKIPEEYFRGFGKVKDDVVIIFDLKEAMNNAALIRVA